MGPEPWRRGIRPGGSRVSSDTPVKEDREGTVKPGEGLTIVNDVEGRGDVTRGCFL